MCELKPTWLAGFARRMLSYAVRGIAIALCCLTLRGETHGADVRPSRVRKTPAPTSPPPVKRVPRNAPPAVAPRVAKDDLVDTSIDGLAAACRRQAERFSPIVAADVAAARKTMLFRLDIMRPLLRSLGGAEFNWRDYLLWDKTRQVGSTEPLDPAELDEIEIRWESAIETWPAPKLVDASEAVRTCIARARAEAAHQSDQRYAVEWNELAGLLADSKRDTQAVRNKIAEAVVARERLGDAPQLTAAIRHALAGPDITLRADASLLSSMLSSRIDEPYRINGIYVGSPTVGVGRLKGSIAIETVASADSARWWLRFVGNSVATTTATSSGTTVNSHAVTDLRGEQLFALDCFGLAAQPSVASGNTKIIYDQIVVAGGPLRRRIAVNRTYGSRPDAERQSAAEASRSLASQLDVEGAAAISRVNQIFWTNFRDPFTRASLAPPVAHFHSDRAGIYGEWRWTRSGQFAAPAPRFDSRGGLIFSADAAAIEQFLTASIGGKNLSEDQLAQRLGRPADDPSHTGPSQPARSLQFADKPCDVELADGRIALRFHVLGLESAGVRYPAMTAEAVFTPLLESGQLHFIRDGGFRTQLVAEELSDQNILSGRQQALGVGLRRSFNRALPERISWSSEGPDQPSRKPTSGGVPLAPPAGMRVTAVSIAEGWLQLALTNKD